MPSTPKVVSAVEIMPATQHRKRSFYRPELDAMRFLAFMMVFIHHTPWPDTLPHLWIAFRAGAYGVCIFFMLSAYLIAELLMRELEQKSSVHLGAFFVRRALRIWPLCLVGIGLGVIFGTIFPSFHVSRLDVLSILFFAGNLYIAKHGFMAGTISILWSISVEEQFYLFIPGIMKVGGKRLLKITSCVCIAAAYLALVWLGHKHASPRSTIWVNSFVQFQFFAAGSLIALHLHGKRWNAERNLRLLMLFSGLLTLCLLERTFQLQNAAPQTAWRLCVGYCMVLASCTLIFLSILGAKTRLPTAFIYLGKISFGLYVYHTLVLALLMNRGFWPAAWQNANLFLKDTCSLAMTIALAAASYHLFEKKILRFKETFAFVKSGAEGEH